MLTNDKLSHYLETHKIEWANSLPDNCPPDDILVPEEEEFYRLIISEDNITEQDWMTYIELYPEKKYIGAQLQLANGLSIIKIPDNKKLFSFPFLNRYKGIAKIILNPKDGVLKKTGSNENHYTWWRTTSFDVNSAEIININEET